MERDGYSSTLPSDPGNSSGNSWMTPNPSIFPTYLSFDSDGAISAIQESKKIKTGWSHIILFSISRNSSRFIKCFIHDSAPCGQKMSLCGSTCDQDMLLSTKRQHLVENRSNLQCVVPECYQKLSAAIAGSSITVLFIWIKAADEAVGGKSVKHCIFDLLGAAKFQFRSA